jgi:hypothetical protein
VATTDSPPFSFRLISSNGDAFGTVESVDPRFRPGDKVALDGSATGCGRSSPSNGRRILGADREFVGQCDLTVTANPYMHVLVDETEVDYAKLIAYGT